MNSCVEATDGYREADGYYRFKNHKVGGEWLVHRWVYKTQIGELGPNDIVRHICNNPWCVELTHLAKGTQKDNMQDRKKAGKYGKITQEQASEIRKLYKITNLTQKEIGLKYGINDNTVSRIVTGKFWKKEIPMSDTPEQEEREHYDDGESETDEDAELEENE